MTVGDGAVVGKTGTGVSMTTGIGVGEALPLQPVKIMAIIMNGTNQDLLIIGVILPHPPMLPNIL
jgi:hypothetical protein